MTSYRIDQQRPHVQALWAIRVAALVFGVLAIAGDWMWGLDLAIGTLGFYVLRGLNTLRRSRRAGLR